MNDPITTLLTALPGLAQAGAAIASTSDQAMRNAQLIEFQRAIIGLQAHVASVQGQNASLTERVKELEDDLRRVSHWEQEKQRYSMVHLWEGAVAYALKESHKETDVPHWICTACFQGRRKSILNQIESKNGYNLVVCPVCGAQIQCPWRNQISPEFAEHYKK